jgi:hypothetical protein
MSNFKVTDRGTFERHRHDELQKFTCGRCGLPKTSKNTVTWTVGTGRGAVKTICNGCYGNLLAKE